MPPKGRLQLTKEELKLLKFWIQAGGNLEIKMNELVQSDDLFLLARDWMPTIPYQDNSQHTFPNLNEYNSNYCTVNYSYAGSNNIEVSFYQSDFYAHEILKLLTPIQSQIVYLNMQSMPLKRRISLLLPNVTNCKNLI